MELSPGTRLGPYEVTALLGIGGMGEVYRATDARLKREVAIKVLPDAVASSPDRLSRFQREAEVLASLNHANIAHVYGLEEVAGSNALVMELVEGPTLADRLSGSRLSALGSGTEVRGSALAVEEALAIAKQLVEALDAAHEGGIVHRDLKPANVKVRDDGTVKVLDFGLAKAMDSVGSGQQAVGSMSPSLSPTITTPAMTQLGMILGTAAYMAPEQARGKVVDRRADIWAFGCVLYEMLTGRRAFDGDEVPDVLAAVLSKEPDWSRLPATVPPVLRRLLRRCLTKDPRRRLADIADARLDLEEAEASTEPSPTGDARAATRRLPLVAGLTALVVGLVAAGLAWTTRPDEPAETRFELVSPPTADPISLAISPDGRQIAFVATTDGEPQLWLRSLDSSSARPLARTEGASFPFWSPDGRAIGFLTGDGLKTIVVASDAVQTLAPVGAGANGAAWGADGVILFSTGTLGPLQRISAGGGDPVPATRLGDGEVSHRFPQFLPDGRGFLFYVRGGDDVRGIHATALGRDQHVRVIGGDVSAPAYVAAGHLFFVRQGDLFAQAFDLSTLTPTGSIERLADRVEVDPQFRTSLAVSATGTLAYRPASAPRQSQFVWFGRSGNEFARVGDPGPRHTSPSLSSDERRVAMQRTYDGNVEIAVLDAERNSVVRVTNNPTPDIYPVWSPDGRELVYASLRDGGYDVYRKTATEAGSGRALLSSKEPEIPIDWSRDGRFILFRTFGSGPRPGNPGDPIRGADLSALPLSGDGKPFVVAERSRLGRFSPDGRWLATESNDTGRWEVFVQPFPGPGERVQVSTNGGAQVQWRRDSRELYYIALDDMLMAVPVRPSADGRSIQADAPRALFRTNVNGALQLNSNAVYAPSADGQRFLMDAIVDEGTTAPIEMILNWRPGVER